MAKHYLLDHIEKESYRLWAIHSSLADYQVAFLLNKHCQTQFKREKQPILWGNNDVPFECFLWEVPGEGVDLLLVANRTQIEEKNSGTGIALFELPQTKEVYLTNQMKHVDFFIMQYCGAPLHDFTKSLQSIPGIEMIYEILPDKQPAELNLIRN